MESPPLPYVCPETHLPLVRLESSLLDALRARLEARTLRHPNGDPVTAPFDGGLLRSDGAIIYPERDGIPHLLAEEAIAMPEDLRPQMS
ncbi:MAG TPA: hypothetical protein VK116_07370 [Planctomycetota bacterium]|nr:hypothetical protein [Planctomycetota bacterium]